MTNENWPRVGHRPSSGAKWEAKLDDDDDNNDDDYDDDHDDNDDYDYDDESELNGSRYSSA